MRHTQYSSSLALTRGLFYHMLLKTNGKVTAFAMSLMVEIGRRALFQLFSAEYHGMDGFATSKQTLLSRLGGRISA